VGRKERKRGTASWNFLHRVFRRHKKSQEGKQGEIHTQIQLDWKEKDVVGQKGSARHNLNSTKGGGEQKGGEKAKKKKGKGRKNK